MDWPLVDCYCCSNHTHRGTRAHGDMSAHTAALGGALLGPVDGDQNVVQACWNPHSNPQCDFIREYNEQTLVLALLACCALRSWPLTEVSWPQWANCMSYIPVTTTNMLQWELQPKIANENVNGDSIYLTPPSRSMPPSIVRARLAQREAERVIAAFMSHCRS